jgi:type IX secretion system PorP/SprF family membrane protein
MRILKALLFFLFVGLSGWLHGQDIHFSQYQMAPLTLNPAYSGAFEGTFRVGGIYRDQWRSVLGRNAFTTPSFFIDAPVIRGFRKTDWVGVGAMVYQDKVGLANLSSGAFGLSVAYHLALDKRQNSVLTLGVQGGMAQRQVDLLEFAGDLKFEDELELSTNFVGFGAQSMDRDRIGDNTQAQFFDMAVGLLFKQRIDEKTSFDVGVAGLHILTPRYNIIQSNAGRDESRLPFRIQAHAQLNADIGEHWMINPTLMYINMAPASQFAVQAWGGRYIGEARDLVLRAGLGYRVADAGEVLLGLDYKDFRVGVSYDVNVSPLREVTNFRGGFEIAAMYTAKIFKQPDVKPVIFCPQL